MNWTRTKEDKEGVKWNSGRVEGGANGRRNPWNDTRQERKNKDIKGDVAKGGQWSRSVEIS